MEKQLRLTILIPLLFVTVLFHTRAASAVSQEFDAGYFSNFSQFLTSDVPAYFSDGWKVDFSQDVNVQIAVDSSGVLEIVSDDLPKNSMVIVAPVTGTFSDGSSSKVLRDCDVYSDSRMCKALYLDASNFASGLRWFWVSIDTASVNANEFHSFTVQTHYDNADQLGRLLKLHMAQHTNFRTMIEANRTKLIQDNGQIDSDTRAKLAVANNINTAVTLATSVASTKPILNNDGTTRYVLDIVYDQAADEAFSGAWAESIDAGVKIFGEATGEQEIADAANRFKDMGFALADLKHGNMVPAWQVTAKAFTDSGIYIYGLWGLYGLEEQVGAAIVAEELVKAQIAQGTLFDTYTDQQLITQADTEIVPDLDANDDCSWWQFYTPCGYGDYNQSTFLDTFKAFRKMLINRADFLAKNGSWFIDVDGDGDSNQDEIAQGTDPNDPADHNNYPAPENNPPVALFSASSYSVDISTLVSLNGTGSYDPDQDDSVETWSWQLTPPVGSSASLSSTSSASPSFTPDVFGDYTIRLVVNDGEANSLPLVRIVKASDPDPQTEFIYENDVGKIYVSDLTVGQCQMKKIGDFTVPSGERWTRLAFAASQGDLILLVDDDETPTNTSPSSRPCPDWTQSFDADREFDYYPANNIYKWPGNWLPGSIIRIWAFSYFGESGFSINSEIRVNYDLDGDGVPDNEEDSACLNNPNETYDSDNDGVCNNSDAFPNDPAASVDTDEDGYPDSWNSGKTENDSTTDLKLDAFAGDPSEWADNDSDGIGDNADLDDDNDQIPDIDETSLGLDPLDSSDANNDLDQDGYTNFSEYSAGTDLNDFESYPQAPSIAPIPNQSAKSGVDYYGPVPSVSGPSAIPLTFGLMDAPAGMTIHSQSGIVTWPEPITAGSPFTINIRVSNAYGQSEVQWNLAVEPSEKPTIGISDPQSDQTVPIGTASYVFNGIASDSDGSISLVQYRINDGSWVSATGTESWTFEAPLIDDQNLIEVRALDDDGLNSPQPYPSRTIIVGAVGCSGVNVVINNVTYNSGPPVVCEATSSIDAGPAVVVSNGANVTYSAPTIVLQSGFSVAAGGTFHAGSNLVAAPASLSVPNSTAAISAGGTANTADTGSIPSEQRVAKGSARRIGLAELPQDLLDLLTDKGIDLDGLRDMLTDAEGNLVVFVSDQDILEDDANGLSDVYGYETDTGQLTLISRTLLGKAGNGASAYPAMDSLGDHIVFQSYANDLVEPDLNEVSDIFLFDTITQWLERITGAYLHEDGLETPAAHPSIDANGENLLYDRVDEDGFRQIYGYDFNWLTAQSLSLTEDGAGQRLDNHHPAISADGRYVAYLESVGQGNQRGCRIHFYDRRKETFDRVSCPEALRSADEGMAPYFTEDAGQVEWYSNGEDEPVVTPNPLLN